MTGIPADTEQEARCLTALLSKEVESHGLLLEEVTLRPSGKQMIVQIIVDKPDGNDSVILDELGEVTTTISNALDKDAPMRRLTLMNWKSARQVFPAR